MSTTVWAAKGTTLAVDEGGTVPTNTYSLINNITSLSNLGGGEVGERDTTVLTSSVKTFAPTIPDNQECTIELNIDPTDSVHNFLRNLKDLPVAYCNFKAVTSALVNAGNAANAIFQAFVKTFDGYNADDVDSNLTATVTLRKTGAVTWSPTN